MNLKPSIDAITQAMYEGEATAYSELHVGSVFRGSMGAARAHGFNVNYEGTSEDLETRLLGSAFMYGYDVVFQSMRVDVWTHLDTGAIVRLKPKAGLNYKP